MELFGVGPGELILVMVIALIVLGPAKLPEIASSLGRAIGEFRRASSALTEELGREMRMDTPPQEPMRTEEPVVLDQAQAAPHIVEESPVEAAPVTQGFPTLSVREDDVAAQAATSSLSAPWLPEGEAEIKKLEAELELKKTASALEIKRLEAELETRRLEAELAAKRHAALAATAAAAEPVVEVPAAESAPELKAAEPAPEPRNGETVVEAGAPGPAAEVKTAELTAELKAEEPAAEAGAPGPAAEGKTAETVVEAAPQPERANGKGA